MPSSDSAALVRSSGPGCGSRNSGRRKGPTASRSSMTGAPARKTEPHQKCSSRRPPANGPMAVPAEKLAIQAPTATVRSAGFRNMLRIKERLDGASVDEHAGAGGEGGEHGREAERRCACEQQAAAADAVAEAAHGNERAREHE